MISFYNRKFEKFASNTNQQLTAFRQTRVSDLNKDILQRYNEKHFAYVLKNSGHESIL